MHHITTSYIQATTCKITTPVYAPHGPAGMIPGFHQYGAPTLPAKTGVFVSFSKSSSLLGVVIT